MRTLESSLGTIAATPRRHAVPVVLSDFETIQVTAPVEQDELKKFQAHFMTLAQCAAGRVNDQDERERVAQRLQERMARYGTSAEYIARRQVGVLTSRFVLHDPHNESESIRRYGDFRNPTGETLDERMTLFEEVACDVFERVYRDPRTAASRRHRARELLRIRLAKSRSDLSLAAQLAWSRRHAFVPHGMLRRVSGDPHRGGARGIVVRFASERQAPRRSGAHGVPFASFRSPRRRGR